MIYNEDYKCKEYLTVGKTYQSIIWHVYTWDYLEIFLRDIQDRIDLKSMQILNKD